MTLSPFTGTSSYEYITSEIYLSILGIQLLNQQTAFVASRAILPVSIYSRSVGHHDREELMLLLEWLQRMLHYIRTAISPWWVQQNTAGDGTS